MKHVFVADISVNVDITQADFEFLIGTCKNHYDYKVTSAVEIGGFMYGIKGRRDWIFSKGHELPLKRLTFRQIDLLCKPIGNGVLE